MTGEYGDPVCVLADQGLKAPPNLGGGVPIVDPREHAARVLPPDPHEIGMARVVMLAMHRDGRIELPPPKWRLNRPAPITFGPDTEPPLLPPPTTLDAVRPIEMRTVVRGDRGG